MKTIVETPGEPYMIEDRTTPIFETKNHKSRLWLSLHEAMSVTGETVQDIIASAETNTPTKKGNQFGYPDRKTLKAYLPDYRVVRGRFNPPVPVTATFEIKHGRRTLREEWHYRTLTAFRQCNELTVRSAEMILSKHAGWKTVLPPLMIGAVHQQTGWVPPGGWPNTLSTRVKGPLFQLGLNTAGVTVKYVGPTKSAKLSDLPHVVITHAG
jgi:hypothetical protein